LDVSRRPKSYRVPASFCPRCGHTLDACSATLSRGGKPKPGDFTFCIECANMLTFDAELRVRVPAPGEVAAACAQTPGLREKLDTTERLLRSLPATGLFAPKTKH
jgi:hypothetical protein